MATTDHLYQTFAQALQGMVQATLPPAPEKGWLGGLDADGEYALEVAGKSGVVYTYTGHGQVEAVNMGVPLAPDCPVLIYTSGQGEQAVSWATVDPARMPDFLANGASVSPVAPHSHDDPESGLFDLASSHRLNAGGLVYLKGGLLVACTTHWYWNSAGTKLVRFDGAASDLAPLDVTANLPSSGKARWAVVCVNKTTGALVAVDGAEENALLAADPATIADIVLPNTYAPKRATRLVYGQTAIQWGDLVDPRPWLDGGRVFVGDSGSGGMIGLVPAPASGDAGKFLRGNGTWDAPTASSIDATAVTYTPSTLANWDSSADPGNQDDVNDQLADRLTVAESDIASLTAGGITSSGWVAAGETWTYASADDPTYTFTISGDLTTKYSAGMRIRLSQSTGGTKYFIITKVAYSAPNTTLTLYGGTDYDLNNEAISNPYFSVVKAPYGFPLDETKWTVLVTDTSDRAQNTPASGTWYNPGSLSITFPIGIWRDAGYQVTLEAFDVTAGGYTAYATLSTANNSESDTQFTSFARVSSVAVTDFPLYRAKTLVLTAKTTYYLNCKTGVANLDAIHFRNDQTPLLLRGISAYL